LRGDTSASFHLKWGADEPPPTLVIVLLVLPFLGLRIPWSSDRTSSLVPRPCRVRPSTWESLATFVSQHTKFHSTEWLRKDAFGQGALEGDIGFGNVLRLPQPSFELVKELARHLNATSTCNAEPDHLMRGFTRAQHAPPGVVELACPTMAERLGPELALIAESLRRGTVLREKDVCRSAFLDMGCTHHGFQNTPGAQLEQMVHLRTALQKKAADKGVRNVRFLACTDVRMSFNPAFGRAFLDVLFGLLLLDPCPQEVAETCALGSVATSGTALGGRGRPGGDGNQTLPVVEMSDLREGMTNLPVVVRYARLEGFNGRVPSRFERRPSKAQVLQLTRGWARMRSVIPLAGARDSGAASALSLLTLQPGTGHLEPRVAAVYVRGGSGAKGAPQHFYPKVLDVILTQLHHIRDEYLANTGRTPSPHFNQSLPVGHSSLLRVEVYYDGSDEKACCSELEAWGERTGVPVMLHVSVNRFLQFAALMSPDIFVTGESKVSELVGRVTNETSLWLDGNPTAGASVHAQRIQWEPCANFAKDAGHKNHKDLFACTPGPDNPGVASNQLHSLRRALINVLGLPPLPHGTPRRVHAPWIRHKKFHRHKHETNNKGQGLVGTVGT